MRFYSNSTQVGMEQVSPLAIYNRNRSWISVVARIKRLPGTVAAIFQSIPRSSRAVLHHLRARPGEAAVCMLYLMLAWLHTSELAGMIYAVIGLSHLVMPHR